MLATSHGSTVPDEQLRRLLTAVNSHLDEIYAKETRPTDRWRTYRYDNLRISRDKPPPSGTWKRPNTDIFGFTDHSDPRDWYPRTSCEVDAIWKALVPTAVTYKRVTGVDLQRKDVRQILFGYNSAWQQIQRLLTDWIEHHHAPKALQNPKPRSETQLVEVPIVGGCGYGELKERQISPIDTKNPVQPNPYNKDGCMRSSVSDTLWKLERWYGGISDFCYSPNWPFRPTQGLHPNRNYEAFACDICLATHKICHGWKEGSELTCDPCRQANTPCSNRFNNDDDRSDKENVPETAQSQKLQPAEVQRTNQIPHKQSILAKSALPSFPSQKRRRRTVVPSAYVGVRARSPSRDLANVIPDLSEQSNSQTGTEKIHKAKATRSSRQRSTSVASPLEKSLHRRSYATGGQQANHPNAGHEESTIIGPEARGGHQQRGRTAPRIDSSHLQERVHVALRTASFTKHYGHITPQSLARTGSLNSTTLPVTSSPVFELKNNATPLTSPQISPRTTLPPRTKKMQPSPETPTPQARHRTPSSVSMSRPASSEALLQQYVGQQSNPLDLMQRTQSLFSHSPKPQFPSQSDSSQDVYQTKFPAISGSIRLPGQESSIPSGLGADMFRSSQMSLQPMPRPQNGDFAGQQQQQQQHRLAPKRSRETMEAGNLISHNQLNTMGPPAKILRPSSALNIGDRYAGIARNEFPSSVPGATYPRQQDFSADRLQGSWQMPAAEKILRSSAPTPISRPQPGIPLHIVFSAGPTAPATQGKDLPSQAQSPEADDCPMTVEVRESEANQLQCEEQIRRTAQNTILARLLQRKTQGLDISIDLPRQSTDASVASDSQSQTSHESVYQAHKARPMRPSSTQSSRRGQGQQSDELECPNVTGVYTPVPRRPNQWLQQQNLDLQQPDQPYQPQQYQSFPSFQTQLPEPTQQYQESFMQLANSAPARGFQSDPWTNNLGFQSAGTGFLNMFPQQVQTRARSTHRGSQNMFVSDNQMDYGHRLAPNLEQVGPVYVPDSARSVVFMGNDTSAVGDLGYQQMPYQPPRTRGYEEESIALQNPFMSWEDFMNQSGGQDSMQGSI